MDTDILNIKFKLIEPGKMKLQLIKAIKSVTDWGLKDCKDFVDSTDTRYQQQFSANRIGRVGLIDLKITKDELNLFESALRKCEGIVFELDGKSKIRNRKLIELGLYEKDELVNELIEDDMYKIISSDIDSIRKILADRYRQLPEDYIKEKLRINNESNL